jgi:hypothetical protein
MRTGNLVASALAVVWGGAVLVYALAAVRASVDLAELHEHVREELAVAGRVRADVVTPRAGAGGIP